MLEWDAGGFGLYLKRLEKGHFKWPSKSGDGPMILSGDELECLLEGTKLACKLSRREVTERATA
jgi:transposase